MTLRSIINVFSPSGTTGISFLFLPGRSGEASSQPHLCAVTMTDRMGIPLVFSKVTGHVPCMSSLPRYHARLTLGRLRHHLTSWTPTIARVARAIRTMTHSMPRHYSVGAPLGEVSA